MKLMLKGFLCIALLASAIFNAVASDVTGSCGNNSSSTACCDEKARCNVPGNVLGTRTHFSRRGQEMNTARRLTAVADKQHRYGVEEFNGTVDGTLQYTQTRHGQDIARYFFGKQRLTYGDACDGTFDIYSVNFGTTASGSVCFNPKVQDIIGDINLWLGWDEFVCGLWTMIDVPITHTRWTLGLQDTNTFNPVRTTSSGTLDATFAPDLVSTTTAAIPFGTLREAWANDKAFGEAPKMNCGKICGKQKDTAVAGVRFDLGYDVIRRECGYLGGSILFIAPTGTKPCDEFLFNAVAGSQHMWQVGGSLVAGYRLWNNCDDDQSLSLYFDGTFTHLFKAKQRRLFALKTPAGRPNPLSSFLLLKKFDPNTGAVVGLERASNILCCESKIDAKVQTDLALMLQYDHGCFSAAVGWNFWLRDTERFNGNCKTNSNSNNSGCNAQGCVIPLRTYGIKGSTLVTDTDTMSNATIGNCGAIDATPVFLTTDDIDFCSALHPRAYSNKVFGWVGYNWRDCEWQPYVAVEGGVEFGHDNKAADQWEVMLKGGVAF